MSYAAITDSSNTFNTGGLSDEDRAMLDYLMAMKAAGLDVVATSTTDHPLKTSSGNTSRHRMAGTNGEGLAIDCRMRRRGNDIHRAVFDAFVPVEHRLQELIYAGAPYNIKAGRRVAPYAVSSHHDHVHVAVTKGTFIAWPAPQPQPQPQPQPPPSDDEFRRRIMAKPVLSEGAGVGDRAHQFWDVGIMQALMVWHKATPVSLDGGPNGRFDYVTRQSLTSWQARTGALAADGVCGPATWAFLAGL